MDTMKVGIIGCGNISNAYFKGCRMFRILDVVACADIDMDVARTKAEEHEVKAVTVDELLADPEIDIVVNLTIPSAHAEVNMMALNAGKHVHCEKPFAVNIEDGKRVIELAKEKDLRVGCAPDTFLGAGLQTCRKVIDDKWIGKPLAGTAFMMGRGPEVWHPNPFFFYQTGGGPMFDMGPYYMTALVHLLGPVEAISAVTGRGFEERVAGHQNHFGKRIPVEVPTHYSGGLVFESGATVNACISFDIPKHTHHPIEIYGTHGSLQVPDPNTFGGDVNVFRMGNGDWQKICYSHDYYDNSRGIGVADMAHAVQTGREHRCSGELACHVLEVMQTFERSANEGKMIELSTTCKQPAPFPLGMQKSVLD